MQIDWMNLLVTPMIGAVVGFGVWFFQSRIETLRRERRQLDDDRRQVYTDVLDPFVRIFAGIKNPRENKKALQQLLSVEYKRTGFQFSLIGDDAVVRSFNNLMQYVYSIDEEGDGKPDAARLLFLWGSFLLAIRKNLGNPKTTLTPADMLRSQIKDIDEALGPSSS